MQRPIMDAGPGLNFFSIHRERLLFGTLGPLSIPEVGESEIRRRSGQDRRFAAAGPVMRKIPEHLLEILSDDLTPDLIRAVERLGRAPAAERLRTSRDLGETLVIAHAAVVAEAGRTSSSSSTTAEAAALRLLKPGASMTAFLP